MNPTAAHRDDEPSQEIELRSMAWLRGEARVLAQPLLVSTMASGSAFPAEPASTPTAVHVPCPQKTAFSRPEREGTRSSVHNVPRRWAAAGTGSEVLTLMGGEPEGGPTEVPIPTAVQSRTLDRPSHETPFKKPRPPVTGNLSRAQPEPLLE
ncbi:MAG: hypothetical protein ACLQVK_22455 [Acidimicrobiales bacterium]